jgi:dipeptidyl-peptidase-4
MIKPAGFDATKSYPVMFIVYGGPGSNTVKNAWGGADYFWHQHLAQEGYIVISVDPRGTMRRGRDFKHSTYLELGKLETEDMIASAKHFGNLNYVDADRIGVMGWSYGGYMSALCLTKGADYFKLGIAVAPVTNWRYYDTVYTERFMRTPFENPSGYDDNSPINFVDQMKGHFMLVHGSGDDNVHYQNSMEMIKALVDADVQFELAIYPNKNHGIYGGNTRYHLFTKMTNFIISNL